MSTDPVVHGRGFPGWGPPSMCGEEGPVLQGCGEITCPNCCGILFEPAKLMARLEELERTVGKPVVPLLRLVDAPEDDA